MNTAVRFGSVLFFCIIAWYASASVEVTKQVSVEESKDSLLRVAQTWHDWTKKHYREAALLDSVIEVSKKVLNIREAVYRSDWHFDLWDAHYSLGLFFKQKGRYAEAKYHLGKSVRIYEVLQHEDGIQSILELGKIYSLEGDLLNAQEYFKAALDQANTLRVESKIQSAVLDLSATYIELQQDSLAIAFMEQNSHLFQGNGPGKNQNAGKFYNNLASAYLRNAEYENAIATFRKAKLLANGNEETLAKIFINLSVAFRLQGDLQQCQQYLQEAKDPINRIRNSEILAFYHKSLARYFELQSDFSPALIEYQRAIASIVPSFIPKNEFENPTPKDLRSVFVKSDLLSYLTDKLGLLMQWDNQRYKQEILELFRLGDQLIDQMREDHFMESTRLYWRTAVFPFYEKALAYCHQENDLEAAFYFLEKSKSVLLLEGYSFNAALSKITRKERDRYFQLKNRTKEINQTLSSQNLTMRTESYQQLRKFVDTLTHTYPKLFRVNQDMALRSLEEFQNCRISDSTTAYVHFFYGQQHVYALTARQEKAEFKRLSSTEQIDVLVQEYKSFFQNPANIENRFSAFQKSAYKLYQKVLAPLSLPKSGNLVIIPDGPLATLPFESLICSFTDRYKFSYLLERQVISYAFSASMIGKQNHKTPKSTLDMVTFEPYEDHNDMEGVHFSGIDQIDTTNTLRNGLRIKRYQGDAATKRNLFSLPQNISIIHFSSHAYDHTYGQPRLHLKDSTILLSDLMTTSLVTDLVFLSACRTHLGDHIHGEGTQSMARGFTMAGAKSVISSLWNVVAAPNSEIVSEFYNKISQGQSKPLALHHAKLQYLKSTDVPSFEKSPYYWAGLVYYGDCEPILFSTRTARHYTYPTLTGILMLLGLCYLVIRHPY